MSLKAFLCDAYDINVRRPDDTQSIRLDDQSSGDTILDFCQICVTLGDGGPMSLTLNNAPHNAAVGQLVVAADGTCEVNHNLTARISIPLSVKDAPLVRKLAKAIRSTTGRGQSYVNRNWKWISRRTADSLERFAGHLASYRRLAGQKRSSQQSNDAVCIMEEWGIDPEP